MDVTTLKIILLSIMGIVPMIAGCLPIKVMAIITSEKRGFSKNADLIVSLLSCFAGGVFLGVCFLDMLPDTLDSWEQVKVDTGYDSDYPFVSLILLAGFFFVYLVEEATVHMCGEVHDHSSGSHCDAPEIRSRAMTHLSTRFDVIVIEEEEIVEKLSKREALVKSLTLVGAILLHVAFEGFAFGILTDIVSVTTLFIGIIIHKAVVSFSIGIRLVQAHPNNWKIVVFFMFLISITAPAAGTIGIIIENSNMNYTAKDIVTTVLLSISLGTFLYVTFFEILGPEHENKKSGLLQWLSAMFGYVVIALDRPLLAKDSALVEIDAPAVVCGSIYGSFKSLRDLVTMVGKPAATTNKYIFMGDFEIGGQFGFKIATLLMVWKLQFPNRIFLLRGINKTSVYVSQMPFREEVGTMLKDYLECYSRFPVSALVSRKILCLRGGVPQVLKELSDLRSIARPSEPHTTGILAELLWNCPTNDATIVWKASQTGLGKRYGRQAVDDICHQLHLDKIIRSGNVIDGYGVMVGQKLVTACSSAIFRELYHNDAAAIHIGPNLELSAYVVNLDAPSRNAFRAHSFAASSDRKQAALDKNSI